MGTQVTQRVGKYVTNDASCPPHSAVPIVPGDDPLVNQIPTTRFIYVGVTGDLTVIMPDSVTAQAPNGTPVTWKNMTVGLHPMQVIQVMATGTTASSMLACY